MLKMASATDSDRHGKLCNAFKSFYNSKNHGAADIQHHQLMEDKGFEDAVFGEAVSMTLWSGNFTRPNPSAPGVLSPFSFKEQEPLGSSQRNRSLILSMIMNAKGDLSKSIDDIKASSKVETTVPSDYYGFIYQMKAFRALIEIITGNDSLVSVQLKKLSQINRKILFKLQDRNRPRQLLPRKIPKRCRLPLPSISTRLQEIPRRRGCKQPHCQLSQFT